MNKLIVVSLVIIFGLLNLTFLSIWAVSFDGCTKCINNAQDYRLNLVSSLTWIHGIKFVIDVFLFGFITCIFRVKKEYKLKLSFFILFCILYIISSIDFWGASVYLALKCGNDCDVVLEIAKYFGYFGNLTIPLFIGALVLLFYSYKVKSVA